MTEPTKLSPKHSERASRSVVVSLASGGVVAIAVALMILQAQAVFINVGGLSLSVYALVLAAGLLVVASVALLFRAVFGRKSDAERIPALRALALLSPLLILSAYASVRLVAEWRLEGAQNLLALFVLTLAPLVFWLSNSWPRPDQALRIVVWVMGPTSLVYLTFRFLDLPGFADRQFAMVALVGLAAAVSLSPRGIAERAIPYIIFVGIVASGSRTASVIALVVLSTLALRSATSAGQKLLRLAMVGVGGVGVGVLAFIALGFVSERVEESGVSGTVAEVIVNSNGRLGAWAEFLNLLDSPAAWLFGRGTGAAMEFGTANLAFFSHPHNEYIRYVVDLGAVGLLLLAGGCALVLITLLRSRGFALDAPRAATLVIVALAGMALTDGPLYSSFVIIPASMIIGVGLRSRRETAAGPHG